jgi:wobble nucleotide-excising tRNase
MEEGGEGKSGLADVYQQDLSIFDLIDSIRKIAASNARSDLNSETDIALFLKSWWSDYYNRPMKDPILQQYTLEELLYEFYDKIERKQAREEQKLKEEEQVEVKKEKEELEASKAGDSTSIKKDADNAQKDPTKDPDNIKWMQEQIEQAKAVYGNSFGEDIDVNF